MKKIIVFILVLVSFCSTSYAETIHFDLSRVEIKEGELFYNLEDGAISSPTDYIWPENIPIPIIPEMPTPNIIDLGDAYNTINGYLTEIDGVTYWAGRTGEMYMPLPAMPMPLGTTEIKENLPPDLKPDIFPYNSFNKSIKWENVNSNADRPVFQASGHIAKWTFDYDIVSKQCVIFVNGIYRINTDIPFRVYGFADRTGGYSYNNVLYWEDETYFYIKNYNLLLKTPKKPLYASLDALENLPVVKLNDTILAFEEPPVMENDRILVPMRFLFEQMGAEVSWDNDTQTATVSQNNRNILFTINRATAQINDRLATMEVPAQLINNKTYVPLRFLSENLSYKVEWDEEQNMAVITDLNRT